jgi:phosphomannomutase
MVRAMQKNACVIGGEGNGGVINPDLHYGRDALVGIAMILQLLADRSITAADYRRELPQIFISKNKVQLSETDPDRALQQIVTKYSSHNPITIDGVKIRFDEGWVHLRKSNTEPIIRIYSEAGSPEVAEALARRIMQDL